jgi:membrane associated rhomboid family serine protease
VCRNCGALVGASEESCSACGAPSSRQQQQQRQQRAFHPDPETLRFARVVVSRPATFTVIFLTACIFLFLLMLLSGGSADPSNVLVAYGAKRNDLIDAGQWWRLVTPVFLHVQMPGFGPLHLIVNMYGLFMLGPYVEKLYGSAKFVFFWVATGVAGVTASYLSVQPSLAEGAVGQFLFKPFDQTSAGASGALFGLVGVLFVFGIKFRRELPDGFKRAFGTGMLPMIFVNLFIGYVGRGFIDNAAHLGGLVSGALLAVFIGYKRPGERARVAHAWHAVQVLMLLLVVVSFVQVARHFDAPAPSMRNASERLNPFAESAADSYVEAVNEARTGFAAALEGDRARADAAIEKLDKLPPLNQNADALRGELKLLLIRARDHAAQAETATTEASKRESARSLEQLSADAKDWVKRFDEWVRTEGKDYGITVVEPSPESPKDAAQEGESK